MSGKPLPTKFRLLRGNPGHQPINKNEPEPPPGLPSCPFHLSKAAKTEWKRIVPMLNKMGMLSKIDSAALAGYCQAYGRWQEAEREIKKQESDKGKSVLTIKTKQGNYIQNPLLGIIKSNLLLMHKFITEFGLSPSSRSRVHVDIPGEEKELSAWEIRCKKTG
jgi:P27 family predicted phage terminase small subunit